MKITSYKKTNGQTFYMVKGYLGIDRTGSKKDLTKRGFANRTDARLFYLNALQEFKENQGSADNPRIKMTDLIDKWMKTYELTVAESTYRNTLNYMDLYIKPEFGGLFVDMIDKPMIVKATHDWMTRTIKTHYILQYLRRILAYAVDLNYADSNPAEGVKAPRQHGDRREEKKYKFLEKEELNQLLKLAEEHLPREWYIYTRLLAMSGLRRGEALALTGKDIDGDMITINKTLATGKTNNQVVGKPKTPKSNRIIRVDKATADMLAELKDGDLPLFRKPDGSYWSLSRPGHWLDVLHKEHGAMKVHPHMFRHTHTALMLEAGAGIAEVQERLGHEKVEITLEIYNHVSAKKKHEAVDKLSSYLTE